MTTLMPQPCLQGSVRGLIPAALRRIFHLNSKDPKKGPSKTHPQGKGPKKAFKSMSGLLLAIRRYSRIMGAIKTYLRPTAVTRVTLQLQKPGCHCGACFILKVCPCVTANRVCDFNFVWKVRQDKAHYFLRWSWSCQCLGSGDFRELFLSSVLSAWRGPGTILAGCLCACFARRSRLLRGLLQGRTP